ncbi:Uncharacterized membrane protein in llm 5'region (plasmid) [Pantoea vagans C9-1]|uniref:GGDEF domain-containing protein n=1 Tax=Pantoea vagans TaxID=470934 RepID=UPI0001E57964|nr:GGDEF domain-containing protein [Pantoea vagans]ADO08105.1 Uncharacterized membrane protein in llm 5'region [Pantoea vagans C9-1]
MKQSAEASRRGAPPRRSRTHGSTQRRGYDRSADWTLQPEGVILLTDWLSEDTSQCAIALDIDHFKRINDWYGHDVGDAVLISLAGLLRQACRNGDVVSRSGGEEFILLLPQTSLEDAARTAECIRETVRTTTFPYVGAMTVSAGVAWLDCCDGRIALLRRDDKALYEAKGARRNAVVVAGLEGFR